MLIRKIAAVILITLVTSALAGCATAESQTKTAQVVGLKCEDQVDDGEVAISCLTQVKNASTGDMFTLNAICWTEQNQISYSLSGMTDNYEYIYFSPGPTKVRLDKGPWQTWKSYTWLNGRGLGFEFGSKKPSWTTKFLTKIANYKSLEVKAKTMSGEPVSFELNIDGSVAMVATWASRGCSLS